MAAGHRTRRRVGGHAEHGLGLLEQRGHRNRNGHRRDPAADRRQCRVAALLGRGGGLLGGTGRSCGDGDHRVPGRARRRWHAESGLRNHVLGRRSRRPPCRASTPGWPTVKPTTSSRQWSGRGPRPAPRTIRSTVAADRTAPTIRLSGAERSNALIDRRDGEALLFFRPDAGGSIRIDAELTDEEIGPASATFPAVTAAGWSHGAETVSTGTGSAPTVTYRSGRPGLRAGREHAVPHARSRAWTSAATPARAPLTFVADADPPTGGALTVNDVAADGSGTQSWDADGTFTMSDDHAVRRGGVGIGGGSGRRRPDSRVGRPGRRILRGVRRSHDHGPDRVLSSRRACRTAATATP